MKQIVKWSLVVSMGFWSMFSNAAGRAEAKAPTTPTKVNLSSAKLDEKAERALMRLMIVSMREPVNLVALQEHYDAAKYTAAQAGRAPLRPRRLLQ